MESAAVCNLLLIRNDTTISSSIATRYACASLSYLSVAREAIELLYVAYDPHSEKLGIRLAEELRTKRIPVESKIFPDGESYLRFTDEFIDQDLVIVQYCFPQQDKRLVELFFMLDTAKELGAGKLAVVIPYLAYARQDRRFRGGEIVSNSSVGRLLGAVGVDLLVTVDVHQEESLKHFKMKTINVSAMSLLAEYLRGLELSEPYILAPDKGASGHAQMVASALHTDYAYFEKHRDRVTGQVMTVEKELPLIRRDVVILDDIISTGTTTANVARIAKRNGAKRIVAACTHALLVGDAEEIIKDAGVTEIVGTDTVPGSASKLSVSSLIADSLRPFL